MLRRKAVHVVRFQPTRDKNLNSRCALSGVIDTEVCAVVQCWVLRDIRRSICTTRPTTILLISCECVEGVSTGQMCTVLGRNNASPTSLWIHSMWHAASEFMTTSSCAVVIQLQKRGSKATIVAPAMNVGSFFRLHTHGEGQTGRRRWIYHCYIHMIFGNVVVPLARSEIDRQVWITVDFKITRVGSS